MGLHDSCCLFVAVLIWDCFMGVCEFDFGRLVSLNCLVDWFCGVMLPGVDVRFLFAFLI